MLKYKYKGLRRVVPMARGKNGRGVGGTATRCDILGRCRDTLYGLRQDYAGMSLTAEEMVDRAGARIHALVLRSDDLTGAVEEWTPAQYALGIKKLGDKTVLDLARRTGPLDPGADRIRVAIAEIPDSPNHYCAISDCKSREFNGVFKAFASKYSPEISGLFLTNEDMAGVLGSIKSEGCDMRVKYFTVKGRRRATGVPESGAKSTSIPAAKFFEELAAKAKAAITVRYTATPGVHGGQGALAAPRGTIARDCRFSVAVGAGALFKIMIPKAIGLSRERNRRIDASAESAGADEVEPTVIRFGKKIFGNKDTNAHCVDIIADMPDRSISKYHVNPHIHLSLVDYTDGSSYDIWVLASDQLTIIPQIRASGASLRRLVNHVFERIGEGRVEK